MRGLRSKFGAVLAGGYLALVVAAVIWAGILGQTNPGYSGEPSLLAFILTLPWSLLAAVALGIVSTRWFESYLGTLIVLGASAAINAVILYLLGAVLSRVFSGARGRT
jgi:hypothetical protein